MSLLRVLERFFETEDELPKHPTQVLKRLGWALAQHMYDSATSRSEPLHRQLMWACPGARGHVTWSAHSSTMSRVAPPPKEGWCLNRVAHFESAETNDNDFVAVGSRNTAKLQFLYTTKDKRRFAIDVAHYGLVSHEYVQFALNDEVYCWLQFPEACIVCRAWDKFGPTEMLEAVSARSACVTHIQYDLVSRHCFGNTTFTTSADVSVWAKYNQSFPNAWTIEEVMDHRNLHEMQVSHLERLEQRMKALTTPPQEHERGAFAAGNVKVLPHASALLTKQLRSRLYRVAKKLLYTKLQEAQERFAADPVRRCAACAVEAAKDQIVLGLEAPKRPRLD